MNDESTSDLRRDIERTQREMSRTIDEIQYRLSPHHMMEQTRRSVREAGLKTSRSVVDRITSNPIPAAMVGIGLWLMMRSNHDDIDVEFYPYESSFDRYGRPLSSTADYRELDMEESRFAGVRDRVSEATGEAREKMHDAGERINEAVDSARERAKNAIGRLRERTGHFAHEGSDGARRAGVETRDFLTSNPLAAGLVGLALGALVGALVPETEREHQLMGATRDQLAGRAKEVAREGFDKAKDIATKVASAATDAVKETARQEASKTDIGTNIGLGGNRA